MSLDLSDLSKNELRFVMFLLRICYKCEKQISITDNDYGRLKNCGCLYHSRDCSPRFREYHDPSNCSLGLKRAVIRGFLNNQDLSTAILQKLRDDCPNLFIVLDSTKNATETLNNEEIVLLIRIFKLCYKCGSTISDTSWYRAFCECCGCFYHGSRCQSPEHRTYHPNSCSYEFSNFGEFFRTHMIDNYPHLMKYIYSRNQIPAPPTQIELLRQELENAKQKILEANNEKESLLKDNAQLESEKAVVVSKNEELLEELVKSNQVVHKIKKQNKSLQLELEKAKQTPGKDKQNLALEESKKLLAEAYRDKVKMLETEEDESDKSLLKSEWKKFEEKYADLQKKTEHLVQETVTKRSAAVMRANNPKILKASETADEVKNSVIETLRTETNRLAETEEEIFPSTPSQTTSMNDDAHSSDVKFLD